MHYLKSFLSFALLILLLIALNTKFASVPPLGKFFDPQAGFWANAETAAPVSEELELEGLKGEVSVYFDERRIPHIFASSDHDLYYALGYLIARDRLFQMELQTYDGAGRLSEILGERTLSRDLGTRRNGMMYGAERAMEFVDQDPVMSAVLQAYADGVNSYINSLDPADYPLEYKVLDIKPEEWSPIKTMYLLKNMTRTLASKSNDIRTSNTLSYFGKDFVETFFDEDPELLDPIIPRGHVWDFEADVPTAPDSLFITSVAKEVGTFQTPEGLGSNNWAVSGSKTASGYPILANDPHLSLTLPSIWYEAQLNAPGINTYGVTFAGAPGIVIGFNEDVAWGPTNVGTDVMDWYEVRFRDESLSEYWHDGEWKPTTTRVEEIKVRDAETVLDTVIYTHHGPVREIRSPEEGDPVYYALRWIAHEASNEMRAFYHLNRAENYDDYVEALSHWVAPAQNFAFASREGDIALWVTGDLPRKWENQGQMVSDGTDPRYDWQGWVPREQNPYIKNPERGFVSSANQESAAPDYPYYMDDNFAGYERGRRINDRLSEMENITVQDMQELQMDSYNYRAAEILSTMIDWLDEDELNSNERNVLDLLAEWDYYNDAEKIAPGVFRAWWDNFYDSIFDDEFNSTQASLRRPPSDMVAQILKEDPSFSFVDDINTPEKEDIRERTTYALKQTVSELTESQGPLGPNWEWGILIDNDINHVGFIPGMGAQNLYSSGASGSVNATRGSNGPSWRMVVELGPEVKGYGVYPGGNSGNPGSPDYDSMLESWRTGQLYELQFLKEEPSEFNYKLTMKPVN